MYWQLNILLLVCGYVSCILATSSQQCLYHLGPFTETTCALEPTPMADQSSVLFPQVSDLDLLIGHNMDHKDTTQEQDNYQGQSSVYNSSPSSSSPHSPVTTLPPTTKVPAANNNHSDRRVTIPSFEEWKKRIRQTEETDNNPKPKRKSTRGAANQGRDTIDSVDGGFSDDVGSVFDSSDPNGPVSTAENTYEEGEYIAPQKQQRQSNKKHFAQVPLKSLKERFNYAWTICAATVRDVNKEARGAQSILFESKDQYLLNKCSADKFVIINLCEEILIDTIVLANFEFFSSTFKDFRVYVSNTYPTKDWQLLGQWQAKNTRDLQVFKVQDSIGWFEYIKIEFLTHYGHEYYCPLSLVRVHGMPMMEYYNAVESQGLSGDGETETLGDQHLWPADLRDDIIQPQLVTNTSEWFPSKGDIDPEDDPKAIIDGKQSETIVPEQQDYHLENGTDPNSYDDQRTDDPTTNFDPPNSDPVSQTVTNDIDPTPTLIPDEIKITSIEHGPSPTSSPSIDTLLHTDTNGDSSNRTSNTIDPTTTTIHTPVVPSLTIDSQLDQTTNAVDIPSTTDLVTASTVSPTNDMIMHSEATPKPSPDTSSSTILESASESESASATATVPSATPSNEDSRPKNIPNTHNKEPATQESIYKIIMKRLNALEANATLSQRYLDEQNNMLNDVFTEMEKRHQDQLILVLDRLNETASSRIDSMKRRYEQSYGELKQQMETDMREMTAKISILTDQISFEKRVSMAQLAIVGTLFVFLAVSRGTMSTLSPVMMAQAEERKRRESDATRNTTTDGKKRSARPTLLKSKLDTSTKIKLGMEGQKAASLDALKLHLAQQADLLPKLPPKPIEPYIITSSPEKPPPVCTKSIEPKVGLVEDQQQQQQQPRNGRSISLDDITNTHDTEEHKEVDTSLNHISHRKESPPDTKDDSLDQPPSDHGLVENKLTQEKEDAV